MALTDEIKLSYQHGSYLTKLIYINIAIWIAVRLAAVFLILGGNEDLGYIDWLALPASFGQFLSRPWTLFTYMFLHYELLHILMNLLWLYSFGCIFLEYHQPRKLLCHTFSVAYPDLFMAAYNFFPFQACHRILQTLCLCCCHHHWIATAVYVPNQCFI